MKEKEILDSWKEISQHLNRTVRTCQRWEVELGLPVHRLDGSPKASVFAYKHELDQWLDEKLHEHEVPQNKALSLFIHKNKFLLIASSGLIAVVVAAVLIWRFFPLAGSAQFAPDKASLAVMYFKNDTGDERLSYWKEALSDLLTSDLSQSRHLDVLSSDRLLDILKELNLFWASSYSAEDLNTIATRAHVDNILFGNYAKSGDEFRIYAFIKQMDSGKEISLERVSGKGEESFFPMVDEMAKKIKESLELTADEIGSDIDKDVGRILTSSPEAYKYYVQAQRYLSEGYDIQGLRLLERAIKIDPEFAMAYRALGITKHNIRFHSEAREYLQKALELSERLSDRDKYKIQADFYYLYERDCDMAIESYRKLLELYPDDSTAINNLGSIYAWQEKFDKAAELFGKNVKNKKYKGGSSYQGLAGTYRCLGMYEKAQEVLNNYLKEIANSPAIHYSLVYVYDIQEKFDLALEEAEKYFMLVPDSFTIHRTRGDVYTYMGNLNEAEKEYLQLLDSGDMGMLLLGRERLAALFLLTGRLKEAKEQAKIGIELGEKARDSRWMSKFHLYLGYSHLRTGDFENALKEWEMANQNAQSEYDIYRERHALHFKSLTHIAMGSLTEAQKIAEVLKENIEKGPREKDIRLYYHLLGEIELSRENYSEAVENFEKAISFLAFQGHPSDDRHALFYQPLACAYFKAGKLKKARDFNEKMTHLTTGRFFFGDIYARSFYMLGRIYEQQDNKGRAIENYEKFLKLYEKADPGREEVDDAEKRLEKLRKSS